MTDIEERLLAADPSPARTALRTEAADYIKHLREVLRAARVVSERYGTVGFGDTIHTLRNVIEAHVNGLPR